MSSFTSSSTSTPRGQPTPAPVDSSSSDADADHLRLTLSFGGGAELLVGNVPEHNVQLPLTSSSSTDSAWTLRRLLAWIRANLLKERPELFLDKSGESVRPGILVLVNDADWELLGQLDYALEQDDQITFISTLHGG